MNAPVRSGSAKVSLADAVLETCKQSDCCQLLPWVAVEIPLPLSEAQWEWRIHKALQNAHKDVTLYLIDGSDHGGAAFWSDTMIDIYDGFIKKCLKA